MQKLIRKLLRRWQTRRLRAAADKLLQPGQDELTRLQHSITILTLKLQHFFERNNTHPDIADLACELFLHLSKDRWTGEQFEARVAEWYNALPKNEAEAKAKTPSNIPL